MQTKIMMGLIVAASFLAGGVLSVQTRAADEIRCRVNAEALVADMAKLSRPLDAEGIKNLLKPERQP